MDVERLKNAYNLTNGEAHVASQLLRGSAVRTIAAERGVSSNAVRFHLKNIFSKTEVRSQAEFVAKVLNAKSN